MDKFKSEVVSSNEETETYKKRIQKLLSQNQALGRDMNEAQ